LAIVTGFYIPAATPPCAETDGPLGALFLARALVPLDIDVVLAADGTAVPALEAGLEACDLLDVVPVIDLPVDGDDDPDDYRRNFDDVAGPVTHRIALERVGPAHTPGSLHRQRPDDVVGFLREVPAEDHDRCHTMRGRDITRFLSPAHRLFEPHPGGVTIGIGDGGNEIGMGKLPWSTIRKNISQGARVACRVSTDHLIVAGVSNWGAYALAAGVLSLRGMAPPARLFDPEFEHELLMQMVADGPLVDGVTATATATVDGLDFEAYARPLSHIAMLLTTPS
jgi:hypothetical protein